MRKPWMVAIAIAIVFTAVLTSTSAADKNPYKMVCYLGSWANYRNGDGKFVIEDIDPFLCTHLVYGFAKLNFDNRIAAYDPYLDLKENWGLGAYQRFTGLKSQNPDLKTLLAIGGWNEGSTKYSQMAKTSASRKVFIDSCVDFLKRYDFDGLDLDWEYPSTRGGSPDDKINFVYLMKEMKEAFQPHGLMLTAAVSAGQSTIDLAYDIPAVSKYLDLINLMAYDFHGGWDQVTGHNAPLYARPQESQEQQRLNVDYAVKYWLKKGASAKKLILGMPLYGRSFTLSNPQNNGLDAPVTGQGMAGEFTREPGFLGYNELCTMLQEQPDWKTTVEEHVQAPYIVRDRQWIGYDDVKSISTKVDYIVKMKLGGGMVWSIETDDFHGRCHGGKRYPLLNAIRSGLNGTRLLPDIDNDDNFIFPTTSSSFSTPIGRTTWIRTTESSSTPRRDKFSCSKSGYFRDPDDCTLFYLCQQQSPGYSDTGYQIYLFTCGAGTVFSQEMKTCAFPVDVPECSRKAK